MSTIPVFLSQVVASATDTLQSGGGSIQTLPLTRYYFYVSPNALATDGQSLMFALKAAADASGGPTWTFVLDADLKLKITHNGGGATDLILGCGLAWNLGVRTTYPPDVTLTIAVSVPAGASGYTAPYRSAYLWCPEARVHATGPKMFDPYTHPGVRTSPGSASYAPDGTAAFTANGEQIAAQLTFLAVEGLYRARESDLTYGTGINDGVYEREAYETFWRVNLRLGRRFLFWRDKSTLIGDPDPESFGTEATAYVEYVPDAETRAEAQMSPSNPDDLYYWTITVGCRTTDRGTDVYQ